MKRINEGILLVLITLISHNIYAQDFHSLHIESVFQEVNKYSSTTARDTMFFIKYAIEQNPYIKILETWQEKQGYYFCANEINDIYIKIAASNILLNKISNYSYAIRDTLNSENFKKTSSTAINEYLSSILNSKRISPLPGLYLESFDYNKNSWKLLDYENIHFNPIVSSSYQDMFKKSNSQYGFVQVISNVKECSIFIDDVNSGKTTNKKIVVPVGERSFVIKKEGYKDCTKLIIVKKREHHVVNCELEEL